MNKRINWWKISFGTGVIIAVCAFVVLGMAQVSVDSGADSDGGLADAYEVYALFFGLDPTNAVEIALDYDGDQLDNREEFVKLADPFYWDTDRDGFDDLIDSNAVSRAYIRWGDPEFTTGDQYEYAHPDWLLGAYKDGGEWGVDLTTTQSCWYVSANKSGDIVSLNIDLDRSILTNNLRYAVHYEGRGEQPCLPELNVDLLDTNGLVVAKDLYGNLFSISNSFDGGTRSVASVSSGETQSVASAGYANSSVVILNVPLVNFPSAAVIQLRHGDGEIFVYEGLLYIDEDGDGLDSDQEKQIGTSDYCVDSNGNGTNDYDECFNSGSSTNNPGGDDGGGDDDGDDGDKDKDKNKGIIYVDQAKGNDTFTGRSPVLTLQKVGADKGPKKTVHGGLSIAETNDTIIIRSGNYNENLDIRGRDVKVFIEGNVRL